MVLSSLIALVALPLAALAAPASRPPISGLLASAVHPLLNIAGCPVDSAVISLPSGQTNLTVPAGQKPVNIALGVGVQNYTCANGVYGSVGAVATLYDISCLVNSPEFAKVQDDFMALPTFAQTAIEKLIDKTPLRLAYHYFVTNPITGSGISPKFAQAANGGAVFTTLAKSGSIHSPTSTSNVDWLQLKEIQGTWASTVFRVDTKLGQPPTTCTGAQSTSIPYAAKYWFYN